MLIVLSPAKSLNFDPIPDGIPTTRAELADEAAKLAKIAKRLSRRDLSQLMSISEKLAELNYQRFQGLDIAADNDAAPAALAFDGDVYDGLGARDLPADDLLYLQQRVRILSGLYGVLRPLDLIHPYRLEMGVRLKTPRGATLYDYWGDRIAKTLKAAAIAQGAEVVVNLASQEYFAAVEPKALSLPVISPRFLEEKAGVRKIISFYAKKARGLMARYAVQHRLRRAEDLKRFDVAGYNFDRSASTDAEWTFVRTLA